MLPILASLSRARVVLYIRNQAAISWPDFCAAWVFRLIQWLDSFSLCRNYRYFQVTSIRELIPSYSRTFTSKSSCKKLAGFLRWVCRLIKWLDSFSLCKNYRYFQVTSISELIPSYSRPFTSKSSSKKLAGFIRWWDCRLIPELESFSPCKN